MSSELTVDRTGHQVDVSSLTDFCLVGEKPSPRRDTIRNIGNDTYRKVGSRWLHSYLSSDPSRDSTIDVFQRTMTRLVHDDAPRAKQNGNVMRDGRSFRRFSATKIVPQDGDEERADQVDFLVGHDGELRIELYVPALSADTKQVCNHPTREEHAYGLRVARPDELPVRPPQAEITEAGVRVAGSYQRFVAGTASAMEEQIAFSLTGATLAHSFPLLVSTDKQGHFVINLKQGSYVVGAFDGRRTCVTQSLVVRADAPPLSLRLYCRAPAKS